MDNRCSKMIIPPAKEGFTLIELMISISIFLFLGIMLISVFKSGMDLWHAGEARKIVYSRARNILSVIKQDFAHLCINEFSNENGEEVDIRMISDLIPDPGNSDIYAQRVRFVREMPYELKDSVLLEAGSYQIPDPTSSGGMYDHFNDSNEVTGGTLRSTGGLAEIGYILKGDQLYRAVKSPVGYKNGSGEPISLFDGDTFFNMTDAVLNANAQVLGRNVLHFEVRFWAPETEKWEIDPSGRADDEACYEWDSTRVPANAFPFHEDLDDADPATPGPQPAQPGDASDDIFPAKIKVILVVDSGMKTRTLSRFVSESGGGIVGTTVKGFKTDSPDHQYIRIGDEWIKYDEINGSTFTGLTRGVRHTNSQTHAEGDHIYQGVTFSMVIDVPGVENE